jgi:transglutaminase-like putative cysteine protease
MRLDVTHATRYRYETPPVSVIEVVRLTPYATATQSVRDWRIDVTGDAVLSREEDAFGNVVHTFTLVDPGEELAIVATGTVDIEPSNGVIEGARERLPLGVYLRQTALTRADEAVAALARRAGAASDGSPLDKAHALNTAVSEAVRFENGATDVATSAADALAAGHGVCQDLAHVLVAAARVEGLPARYVSGYQFAAGRARDEHASHAWVEIHVEGLGWVSFDPTAGTSATEAYVRLAVGLDYLGASPVRGAVYGGSGEQLTVDVSMDRKLWQSQSPGAQSEGLQ